MAGRPVSISTAQPPQPHTSPSHHAPPLTPNISLPATGFDGNNQFPMNEIILRFDKMMHGRQKTEKKEMLLKDCVPILTEMESEKLVNEVRAAAASQPSQHQ